MQRKKTDGTFERIILQTMELCKRTPLSKSTMIDNEKFIFLSMLLQYF